MCHLLGNPLKTMPSCSAQLLRISRGMSANACTTRRLGVLHAIMTDIISEDLADAWSQSNALPPLADVAAPHSPAHLCAGSGDEHLPGGVGADRRRRRRQRALPQGRATILHSPFSNSPVSCHFAAVTCSMPADRFTCCEGPRLWACRLLITARSPTCCLQRPL